MIETTNSVHEAQSSATESRPSFLSKLYSLLRFPYRNDPLFSVVFFGVLFVPLASFSFLTDGYETPKFVLWIVTTGIGLLTVISNPEPLRFAKPALYILLIFFAWSILSVPVAAELSTALFGLPGRFTSSVLFYGMWVVWTILTYNSLDEGKLTFLTKTVAFSGALIAAFGIIQQQGIAFYQGLEPQVRSLAPSFLGNPNFSGMYVATVAPLGLYWFFESKKRSLKYYYGTATFVIIWASITFTSRGAIIGLIAGLAIFAGLYLWRERTRFVFIGLLVTFLITAGLFVAFFTLSRPNAVKQTVALTDYTASTRVLVWADSAQMMFDRPWFGVGHGSFYVGFKKLGDSALGFGERFDDAHNLYLHLAVTGGVPLAVLFILLLLWTLYCGWYSYRHSRHASLAAALTAGLAAWMVVVNFNPVTIACWVLLSFLVAAILFLRFYGSSYETVLSFDQLSSAPAYRRLGILMSLVLILYGLSFIVSEALTYQATVDYRSGRHAEAAGTAGWAYRIHPLSTGPLMYKLASEIKLGRDPGKIDAGLRRMAVLHPQTGGNWQIIDTLYYGLYVKTGNELYKQKIMEAMEEALALEPNYGPVYAHQSYMLYKIGEKQKSYEYTLKALALNKDQFYSWILLARHYQEQGQKQQMLFALKKALAIQPDLMLIKLFIGEVEKATTVAELYIPVNFVEPEI